MIIKEKNSQIYMIKMSKLIKLLLAMSLLTISAVNCFDKKDSDKKELAKIHSIKDGYTISISKDGIIGFDYKGKTSYLTGRIKENFSGLEIKNNNVIIKYSGGKPDTIEYLGNGSFR